MVIKKLSPFSDLSMKIAASVIAGLILGIGATGFAFIDGKASKDDLIKHNEDNKRVENAVYWQIGEQRSGNNEKWLKQENRNLKLDEKLDKIIDILNEISGDNKAIKVEIKYLSLDRKKSLTLIDETTFGEECSRVN